jgi:signal transduction histidine kinase
MIETIPGQMRQLFQNLISNAIKFRKDHVPPVINITGDLKEGEDKSVVIKVSDNGIGFDEKYLERIFTIFQRLHGRSEYQGTGIGLAICKKIIESHYGTITAESTPDVGSTFIITIPLRIFETVKADSNQL